MEQNIVLRRRAIDSIKFLLEFGTDYQTIIDIVFNDCNDYDALFDGMDTDERFEEAYAILADAETEEDVEAFELQFEGVGI